jgi:hypothetical protein
VYKQKNYADFFKGECMHFTVNVKKVINGYAIFFRDANGDEFIFIANNNKEIQKIINDYFNGINYEEIKV